jgi:glycosyltransferase involved in cell wall biosynthesis
MLTASVIVPARNAAETLPRTLASLARQDLDGSYEVIVVDDGSTDDTAQLASAGPGPVTVVGQGPLGPAAARNRGVEQSRARVLAFCDADVYPCRGWLRAGVAALEHADFVQGQVLPDPEVVVGPFDRTIWVTSVAGLFESANLFIGRQTFELVGGFQEWIRPRRGKALAEDVWLGHRALRRGMRCAFCAEALAYHAVFPRSWAEYVLERRRLEYFPAMARKMPELRRSFLYRRVFLNSRTARFDLALAGAAAILMRSSPLPLAAAIPYLRELRRHSLRARPAGPRALAVSAADLVADAVGLAAMIQGSARYSSLVV